MIEWIVFTGTMIAFLGFNVWQYYEHQKRLTSLESLITQILEISYKTRDNFYGLIDNYIDIKNLKSNDEEIIHGLKDVLTGIEQLDNVMLDMVNNLTVKEEKKPKKSGKK